MFWALLFTGACMVIELVGGIVASSLTLLADAAHMLTDCASLAMSYAAVRAALRPASARMNYGHHRWQVLAAFVNGNALMVLAAWIVFEAGQRLFSHNEVRGGIVASIAVLGLISNFAAFMVLSRGESNLNVRGALSHVIGDMLGSGAALLAGLVIYATGWMPIDALLSAVVALLMIRSGWAITRQSAHILLQGAPDGLDQEKVSAALRAAVPQLEGIHHLHSWLLTDERPTVTLHAVLKDSSDQDHAVRAIIRELRTSFNVIHATIQVEHAGCAQADSDEAGTSGAIVAIHHAHSG